MRRHGNVCDTLVFCLVAVLLPAWLLGHLFLTFFPARSSNTEMAIAASSTDVPSRTDVSLTPKHTNEDRSEANTRHNKNMVVEKIADSNAQSAEGQNGSTAIESKIADLKTENVNLTRQANELQSQKSDQSIEINKLKDQLAQISHVKSTEDTQAVARQLQSLKSDFSQLTENHQSMQTAKSSLESKIKRLESRNQQLAMRKGTVVDKEGWQREMESKVQQLEEQLRESKTNLAEQQQLVQTMKAAESTDSETTQEIVAAREQLLREAIEQKRLLQARVSELTLSLDSASSKIVNRNKELADFRQQLQTLKAKYDLTLKRLASADTGDPQKKNVATSSQPSSGPELTGPTDAQSAAEEQYREYVSIRGNRSRLAFIQWVGDDQVIVRSFANKQLYQLPLSRFSDPDQQYLISLKIPDGQ